MNDNKYVTIQKIDGVEYVTMSVTYFNMNVDNAYSRGIIDATPPSLIPEVPEIDVSYNMRGNLFTMRKYMCNDRIPILRNRLTFKMYEILED